MKFSLSLLIIALVFTTFSQEKKIIDHTVYNDWKRLEKQQVSKSGKWISYEINPHRGDGYLYLYNTETAVLDSFYRAGNAKISPNENYFVFKLTPGFDTLRQVELKKVDKKKWPQDSLVILRLSDREKTVIPKIKSFQLPEEGDWMAYSIDSNFVQPKKETKKAKGIFKKWRNKKTKEVKEPKISSD
ncbi:MAG: hypothetical protein KJ941_01405, partial [Bacteroidetes bacterium]|nr:hypothetical protein [Bacteroidota bacterium]